MNNEGINMPFTANITGYEVRENFKERNLSTLKIELTVISSENGTSKHDRLLKEIDEFLNKQNKNEWLQP
jgi:DTW domain-containing protein YfiP